MPLYCSSKTRLTSIPAPRLLSARASQLLPLWRKLRLRLCSCRPKYRLLLLLQPKVSLLPHHTPLYLTTLAPHYCSGAGLRPESSVHTDGAWSGGGAWGANNGGAYNAGGASTAGAFNVAPASEVWSVGPSTVRLRPAMTGTLTKPPVPFQEHGSLAVGPARARHHWLLGPQRPVRCSRLRTRS